MIDAITVPRAGSRAYSALTGLHSVGGRADLHAWMNSFQWSASIAEFMKVIVLRLQHLQMIKVDCHDYTITRAGLEHLGLDADAPALVAPVAAQSRLHFAAPTLAKRHMIRVPVIRPGALDYASIPSRMGNELKPHLAGGRLAGSSKR